MKISLLVVGACLLMASCSRQPAAEGKGKRPGSGGPVPVLAARAVARDMPVEIQSVGTVQAFSLVSMRSQITGPIVKVHIQEGQEVKAGDMLFTIDPRPYHAALNQAQANLKRDEAQLLSARLEFERTSNLFEGKIASRADYETAEAAYRALDASTFADNAAISNAQVSLEYTAIRSPIDGRTGSLNVREGNVVKSPDDVILTITQIHPIYVAFSVPEQHLSAIRRRASEAALPVQAVVPGQTNRPAWGELTFIDNQVDNTTGTIPLKGTFPNTNNLLWPGQFVQTSLTLSNLVNATVVPSQAVQTGQDGEFIFVVKSDETVEARPVVTSVTADGLTVIGDGIRPGETVVTDGQLRLVPGTRVNIKTALSASASAEAPAKNTP
jgi:multidrug efflux system membrane fusion protein